MDSSVDRALIERWVATWREAESALGEQRRAELELLATPRALSELAAAFEHARLHSQCSDTSGLVEQQRYFQQLVR
jgi:flagellar biosynthesis regulator FlbT